MCKCKINLEEIFRDLKVALITLNIIKFNLHEKEKKEL